MWLRTYSLLKFRDQWKLECQPDSQYLPFRVGEAQFEGQQPVVFIDRDHYRGEGSFKKSCKQFFSLGSGDRVHRKTCTVSVLHFRKHRPGPPDSLETVELGHVRLLREHWVS